MSGGEVLLWIILPYVAITLFAAGHWWRYRHDQFRWTSRSTQLLDRSVLGWASPAFHYGALAAAAGHFVGLVIPPSVTDLIGIHEGAYRWLSAIGGAAAGLVSLIGFVGLCYRRATSARVRGTTTRMDILTYALLTFLIVLGCWLTFDHNLLSGKPYNYRVSIGVWWRSIFYLDPNVSAASSAPIVYQVHAIVAWAFWAAFPFSRLVHAWSIPLQYVGRPYIIYRRRFQEAR